MARHPRKRAKDRAQADFAGFTLCYTLLMTRPCETSYRIAAAFQCPKGAPPN
jgi:hypothetical protein